MATKTFKVALSLDNPRIIQSGITVQSFDKQSVKISIALTKDSQTYQIPIGATIRISLLKLSNQAQKIIVDVPNTNRDSIDWIVPDYLDGYQGTVRVGVYLVSGAENVDLGYFTILSNVSDIDKMADEFTDNVFQGWEKIEADLNELNLTIAQTKLDLADDLTQIDNTIANINTLASDFTADVATKQADVTSKYNAFDTSVTTAGQTIDDILALQPQFQAVIDETTGKDVISAPEVILARGGAETLGERLDSEKAEVTAQLAQAAKKTEVQSLVTNKAEITYVDAKVNDIGVSQINKNKGKFDQTYMSDEFLQQITGNAPVNSTPADNSLVTQKYVNDSVTHSKRTAFGNSAIVGYYQQSIDFDTANAVLTIPEGTQFRSGFYTKTFDTELTIVTGGSGYHLVWDVKTNEVYNIKHIASNAAYNENIVIVASVAYPADSVRIKVEGLENYTINGNARLIPSTEQTYLGKNAHIIMGYGRSFDLNTETHQLKIPKDTAFRNGKYSIRLADDLFIDVPDGYNLIYLDTKTNSFVIVSYTAHSANYRESYLYVCSLQKNTTYPWFNNIQGVNDYTINGSKGKLSDFDNDLNLETMKYSMDHPMFMPKKNRFIGHRGLSGLKPENTIPAFDECGIKGIFGVETDIRKTLDGHFVCMHDVAVDRTTNGTGNVSDMTLAQIRSLTIDYGKDIENYNDLKVPTLEEMLHSCARYGTVPMLHLYTDVGDEPAIVEIVNALGFEKSVIYTTTSPTMLNNLASLADSLIFGLGGSTSDLSTINPPTRNYYGSYVDFNAYDNYPNAIKDIHSHKMLATTWVVNDTLKAKELFEKGIDLIATDLIFSLDE